MSSRALKTIKTKRAEQPPRPSHFLSGFHCLKPLIRPFAFSNFLQQLVGKEPLEAQGLFSGRIKPDVIFFVCGQDHRHLYGVRRPYHTVRLRSQERIEQVFTFNRVSLRSTHTSLWWRNTCRRRGGTVRYEQELEYRARGCKLLLVAGN